MTIIYYNVSDSGVYDTSIQNFTITSNQTDSRAIWSAVEHAHDLQWGSTTSGTADGPFAVYQHSPTFWATDDSGWFDYANDLQLRAQKQSVKAKSNDIHKNIDSDKWDKVVTA